MDNTWEQMLQGQQGVDPDLMEMQYLAQSGQIPMAGPQLSLTKKVKTPKAGPTPDEQKMLALVEQYGLANQEALKQQEQGVNTLADYVQQAQSATPAVDWRPLASIYKMDQSALPSAETPEARQTRLLSLENHLQGARKELSQGKLGALKEQIQAYKAAKDNSLDEELKTAKIGFYTRAPGMQADRQMFTAHTNLTNKVKNDRQLGQRLAQLQNLQNSMDIAIKADVMTPQQFHEWQQSVRSNLGLKGTSGVSEREETQIKSLGMNVANVRQFLTGVPQDVNNPELFKHLKELVAIEQQNLTKQAEKRVKGLVAGYEHMYNKNPAYKKDLDNAVKAAVDQFGTEVGTTEGETKEWEGKTFKFTDGKWVRIK